MNVFNLELDDSTHYLWWRGEQKGIMAKTLLPDLLLLLSVVKTSSAKDTCSELLLPLPP